MHGQPIAFRAGVLIASLLFAAGGCDGGPGSADGQTLIAGNGAEPEGLDPHITSGTPSSRVIYALSDNLLRLDPETLKPEPALAEDWAISDDGTTYTFRLREGVQWSNGDPITAEHIVYSWRRALSPAIGNRYAQELYPIVNAEAFATGEIDDFSRVGVKAPDKRTVRFELDHPSPTLIYYMADRATMPVHPPTVERFGAIDERDTDWTRPGHYVSTGPFVLKQWQLNQNIVVEKNPRYWDAEAIELEQIHFRPIGDSAAEERMFRAGQLDLTLGGYLQPDKIGFYRERFPEQLNITPAYATYFYVVNTTRPPFDDPRVRRALGMAIDRRQIVEHITKADEPPAHALTPPDPHGYRPEARLPTDKTRARELLAEAGYPDGEGFPEFTLTYNTLDKHRKIAIAIQQMWKKTLGIDVVLENQEWKVFLDNRQNLNYAVARAGSIGSFVDPADFLSSYTSDNGMNDTGWSNAEYDALIQQAARTTDTAERFRLLQQAEAIIVKQAPILPIYYYTYVNLISPEVENWHYNAIQRPFFKGVHLSQEETQ